MPALLVVLALVAMLAGSVAAVAGFGIGSLMTPVLAVTHGTKVAVILVAIPHLTATALRAWMLRRQVDRRIALTFGGASAAGGLTGALIHAGLGSRALGVLLGVLLLFAGLSGLTGLSAGVRIQGRGASIGVGVLSGLFGGLVGNQGGIRTAALLHHPLGRLELVATATAVGLAVDVARIPVYIATGGHEIVRHWPAVAVGTIAVLVGTVIGTPLLRRLPEAAFRRAVFGLVTVLGLAFVMGLVG